MHFLFRSNPRVLIEFAKIRPFCVPHHCSKGVVLEFSSEIPPVLVFPKDFLPLSCFVLDDSPLEEEVNRVTRSSFLLSERGRISCAKNKTGQRRKKEIRGEKEREREAGEKLRMCFAAVRLIPFTPVLCLSLHARTHALRVVSTQRNSLGEEEEEGQNKT